MIKPHCILPCKNTPCNTIYKLYTRERKKDKKKRSSKQLNCNLKMYIIHFALLLIVVVVYDFII